MTFALLRVRFLPLVNQGVAKIVPFVPVNTLREQGNVLVPSYCTGVVYELFEILHKYLSDMGCGHVPLYFVSPVADNSLSYVNILGEWMSQERESRIYVPDPPFIHAELTKAGKLHRFETISDGTFGGTFKAPCVVFAGHPSLRFGDAVHLMKIWGRNPKNTVIFIDPDLDYAQAVAPFQPLAAKFEPLLLLLS